MINDKTILGVITARGGSKGVPRKNIRIVGGKPLIAWTIEAAQNSQYIDRFILSSEDHEIISVAQSYGCDVPFIRPTELAQDDTPGIYPVLHAINSLPKYDYVILLQPTSPLRSSNDIDKSIEKTIRNNVSSCVSVTEVGQNPYWMYRVDSNGHLSPLFDGEIANRRQDLPKVYILNGAIYIAKCKWLLHHRTFLTSETVAYHMPSERSLDIDTEIDIDIFYSMMKKSI